MKKEVEIKVPAKPAREAVPASTKKITKTVCDFCIADLPERHRACSLCQRDTCQKHISPDPDEPGDYPEWFCDTCMPLLLPARREMFDRHWLEEEALEAEIKKQSLSLLP